VFLNILIIFPSELCRRIDMKKTKYHYCIFSDLKKKHMESERTIKGVTRKGMKFKTS